MSVNTIVVGADGSEGSTRAVEWVAGLASQIGGRVVAVHTFEPLAHLGDVQPPYDFALIEERVKEKLESDWCAPLAAVGVEHECRLMHGTAFQCLIDAADEVDADMIVVGARGYGLLKGLALGSTSGKLLHLSKRPVTVLPHIRRWDVQSKL